MKCSVTHCLNVLADLPVTFSMVGGTMLCHQRFSYIHFFKAIKSIFKYLQLRNFSIISFFLLEIVFICTLIHNLLILFWFLFIFVRRTNHSLFGDESMMAKNLDSLIILLQIDNSYLSFYVIVNLFKRYYPSRL